MARHCYQSRLGWLLGMQPGSLHTAWFVIGLHKYECTRFSSGCVAGSMAAAESVSRPGQSYLAAEVCRTKSQCGRCTCSQAAQAHGRLQGSMGSAARRCCRQGGCAGGCGACCWCSASCRSCQPSAASAWDKTTYKAAVQDTTAHTASAGPITCALPSASDLKVEKLCACQACYSCGADLEDIKAYVACCIRNNPFSCAVRVRDAGLVYDNLRLLSVSPLARL